MAGFNHFSGNVLFGKVLTGVTDNKLLAGEVKTFQVARLDSNMLLFNRNIYKLTKIAITLAIRVVSLIYPCPQFCRFGINLLYSACLRVVSWRYKKHMSKTLLTKVTTYLNDEEMRELDTLRGDIPRSRVMSRALRRYIIDVESGKESLLPGRKVSPNQAQTAAVQKSFASSQQRSNLGGSATKKGDAG